MNAIMPRGLLHGPGAWRREGLWLMVMAISVHFPWHGFPGQRAIAHNKPARWGSEKDPHSVGGGLGWVRVKLVQVCPSVLDAVMDGLTARTSITA